MDRATLLGMIGGIAVLTWGIYMGGSLSAYIDIPSFLIVFGGVIGAVFISFPFSKVIETSKILKIVFFEKQLEAEEVISTIVNLADIARKEGLLALEDSASQLKDDFLKRGILLVVDGTDPELVKSILETELSFLEERHKEGQSLFETMGALAPAFGMIGTIIGLINMLKRLDDPSAVGPGMATALITTFYGSILANLLFLPIAAKLKVRSKQEILIKEVMIEGVLSIQAGENPRIIEEKLKAFLAPKIRKNINVKKAAESGEINASRQTAKI